MPQFTFRKTDENEALIYHDGELVGDLYRHHDTISGQPFYLVLLDGGLQELGQGGRPEQGTGLHTSHAS